MKSKEKKSVNKMEDSPPYVWTQEKSIILHLINKKKASNPSGLEALPVHSYFVLDFLAAFSSFMDFFSF